MSADNHAGKSAGTYLLASCKILALSKNSRLPFIRPKAGALLAYQTRFEVYVWAPTRSAAERRRDQLILSQKSKALINPFLERRRQSWSAVVNHESPRCVRRGRGV